MSTGQETVTPQKPLGGDSVAPSPAALSPVLEGGFLTTMKALSREATRVWAIPVSDHCKGDKEVLINVVLWSARNSGTSRVPPAGYMCAITSRMHEVCDERGNYLFKSVGSLAGRPRPWQGRSRQSAR